MFPLIMFYSSPVLGHRNNFKTRKRYRAPHAQTLKVKEERSILSLVKNIFKNKGDMENAYSGVV